jgi:PAS domain S-box-containing protein
MGEDLSLPGAQRPGSDEKTLEALLSESSFESLPDLLKHSHDCVIVCDENRRVIFWNAAAEGLYGWAFSEARGQVPETLLRTAFPGPLREIEAVLAATGKWEGELAQVARDGTIVPVISRWLVQTGRNGQRLGHVRLERDLTEQRRLKHALNQAREALDKNTEQRLAELAAANEALMESQARFQQISEAIHDVVWLTNPGRTITMYVNPAYELLWERSCQSLYADPHSWLESVHPEDRPRLRHFFAQRTAEEGHEQSYRIVRPDCSVRWVVDRGFPVHDNAGSFCRVVGIIREVTEQKELEKEILAISEREQRRIGQDLHDDLCQQLAGIEFLGRALEEQLGTRPQAAKAAEISKLIRQAIDYTRQLAKGLAPVEFDGDGLMRGLHALAERTSQLFNVRCSVEDHRGFVIQDPMVSTHLYRIAQEAVANSIKHGQATRIRILLEARPEGGKLAIEDNGKGLPVEAHFSGGMGLRMMRYRADTIAAALTIERPASGGTMIVCAFPPTAW